MTYLLTQSEHCLLYDNVSAQFFYVYKYVLGFQIYIVLALTIPFSFFLACQELSTLFFEKEFFPFDTFQLLASVSLLKKIL